MKNFYTIKSKLNQIKKAQLDFYLDFKEMNNHIFTTKEYFYFFIYKNIKYIHKDSLFKCYTNLDTFTDINPTPNFCNLYRSNNYLKPIDIINILYSNNPLLPDLKESSNFLYYDHIIGNSINELNNEDFLYIKKYFNFNGYTPFYNSMCYNLIKTKNNHIYLIDMKHFEKIDDKPFFIYMNNIKHNINNLYIENIHDLSVIINHLKKDYNLDNLQISIMGPKND